MGVGGMAEYTACFKKFGTCPHSTTILKQEVKRMRNLRHISIPSGSQSITGEKRVVRSKTKKDLLQQKYFLILDFV